MSPDGGKAEPRGEQQQSIPDLRRCVEAFFGHMQSLSALPFELLAIPLLRLPSSPVSPLRVITVTHAVYPYLG